MVPNIDTFEYDIKDEIKKKEASITEIASSSNDINNTPKEGEKKVMSPSLIILISVVILLVSLTLAYLGYSYYENKVNPKVTNQIIERPIILDKSLLPVLSSSISNNLDRYVDSVEKKNDGFIVRINSYSPVFSYFIKNEDVISKDLIKALNEGIGDENLTLIFKDLTVNNINMRIATNASTTVIYSFISNKGVVISNTVEGIINLSSDIIR